MTFLEAAIEVLRREGKPLHFKDLTRMAIKYSLLSVVGRDPEQMMQTRLQAEVRRPSSDLVRISPGVFGLRGHQAGRSPGPGGGNGAAQADEASASAGAGPGTSSSAGAAGSAADGPSPKAGGRRRRDRSAPRESGPPGGSSAKRTEPPPSAAAPAADASDRGESRRSRGRRRGDRHNMGAGTPPAAANAAPVVASGGSENQAPAPAEPAASSLDLARPEPVPVSVSPRIDVDREAPVPAPLAAVPAALSAPLETVEPAPSVTPTLAAAAESGPAPRQPEAAETSARERETGTPSGPGSGPGAPAAAPLGGAGPVLMPVGPSTPGTPSPPPARAPAAAEPPPTPRLMTLADAAYDVLRGSSDGRPIHFRQIAEIAIKRRLVRGDLADVSRALRGALVREQRQRDSEGLRPRIRSIGQGQFALGERKLEPDLYGAERDMLDRLNRTREAMRVGLRRRLRSMPAGPFELLMRLLLERLGMVGAELIKRGEGVAYYGGTCSRGSRTLKLLCAIRPGEAEISREAVGELRAGVRLRSYDEGLLLCAARLSGPALAEASAPPAVDVYDQDALTDLLIRHQLGVRRMNIPVDYIDTELFNELLDQT